MRNKITMMYNAIRDSRSTALSLIALLAIIVSLNCASKTNDGIGTPVLVVPEDGSTITQNPPLFVWHSVGDVVGYNLQVFDATLDTLGPTIIDVSCYLDTTYLPSYELNSGSYNWRVQAVEGG